MLNRYVGSLSRASRVAKLRECQAVKSDSGVQRPQRGRRRSWTGPATMSTPMLLSAAAVPGQSQSAQAAGPVETRSSAPSLSVYA